MHDDVNRSWKTAVFNGFACRCPRCGDGALFTRYLKVAEHCPACGAGLSHHRADDAPAYLTIVVVGHIIVPLALIVEKLWKPAIWVHMAIWMPLIVILSLWLLPRIKGAVVGLQWALRMHGFDPEARGSEQ